MPSAIALSPTLTLLIALTLTGCSTARQWEALAVHDAKEIVTAPRRATAEQWRRAALVAGAVVASTLLDDVGRDAARANQSSSADNAAEIIEPFGGRYSDRLLYGFALAGLAGNRKAQKIAFDGLVSSVIASKIITPVIKQVAGRDRPNESATPWEFTGGSSFPSNHATQGFAVAAVVAGHYDSRWVATAAYGLASLVGASRVYHDAHWLSDVVAGAVIGTSTGRFIVATNNRRRARWTVYPICDDRRRGLAISFAHLPLRAGK